MRTGLMQSTLLAAFSPSRPPRPPGPRALAPRAAGSMPSMPERELTPEEKGEVARTTRASAP